MSEKVLPNIAPAGAPSFPIAEALPARRSFHLDDVGIAAAAGRVLLIGFAVFVLCVDPGARSWHQLLAIGCATLLWYYSLRKSSRSVGLLLGPVGATALGTGVGAAVTALVNESPVGLHASPASLGAAALGVFGSALVWEWCVGLTSAGTRRVLLVGTEDCDPFYADELRRSRSPRLDVVGGVAAPGELAQVVEAQHPDIVVLMDDCSYDAVLERLLDARTEARVASFACFCEHALGRIPITHIRAAWFMGLFHPRQHVYGRLAKRVFDVVVAVVALVLLAPIGVVLAVLCKASTGMTIYRQTRVGEAGQQYTIYKFPSMRRDAEQNGAAFALDHDPRSTRLGAILRRTHLDELPQLWNVLRGDMSIVGPRPERPEFVDMIEAEVPFWSRRLLVKPGITGWAQVRCDYAASCDEMAHKLSYDLWYLRHRTMLLDLAICLRTAWTIVTPRSLRS